MLSIGREVNFLFKPTNESDNSSLSKFKSSVDVDDLDSLSIADIANALEQEVAATSDEAYDPSLIEAYLEALDKKTPMPQLPRTEEAYKSFQRKFYKIEKLGKQESLSEPYRPIVNFNVKRPLLKVAFLAAVFTVCMLGGMVIAQASGVDVFGAMARWTQETFSFGKIRIQDATDKAYKSSEKGQTLLTTESKYSSLQAALDEYKVVDVIEPKWIPENYTFHKVDVTSFDDPELLIFCAEYLYDTNSLSIIFMSYDDEPTLQIEKTSADVEIFEVNGTEFYMLENISSNSVSWITPQFECCISGEIEKQTLKEIVNSMFN
jgi:hypothetical protein